MSSVSAIPAVLPARDRTHTARQLVIIDSSVSELPSLIADVRSHSDVLVLDSARDGIAQISEFLSSVSSISSLHLVSHGTSGNLSLGNSKLNLNSLDRYLQHLKSWRTKLDGADLFLYGCQVAAHGMGELFIQQLHRLTGANIAASTELVGNAPQGSNWILDVHAGQVTSSVVFSEQLQQSYSGHFIEVSVSQNTDTLIETEGTAYTLTFELDEVPDQTVGTTFLLRTSVPNALGEFNVVGGGVTGLSGAPIIANATDILVNVDGQVGGSLPPDGPPFFASITVPVINDATNEGPEEITWEILPVPPELEGSAPGVTDGVTINSSASDVTVTIFDDPSQVPVENDPPTITSAAAVSVAENQTNAIDVESTDDSDSEGSGLTYSITGGADASAFSIDADSGVVTFNEAPDFEAPADADGDNDFEIQVTVTDSGGESTAQDITVSVTDVVENAAPTITSADVVSVEENQTAAIDVESSDDISSEGDGLTYTISGGADASAFSIDADTGVVSFNDAPDFEAPGDANGDNDFELQVTVSDADGLTDSQDITVSVSDVVENAAPTITSPAAVSVEENQTAAIDVESSDDISSEGDGLTYAISGGADASAFSIDAGSGVVTFNDAPDFEAPGDANGDNDFELQVTVSDADGLTDSQDITVSVSDVDETAPVPVVSFEISPTEVSETGSFEERTITRTYTVDGEIPEGGLSVLVSLDNFGDLLAQGFEVSPTNFVNLEFGDGFFPDINAFEVILTGQTASFDIVLADDLIQEEDTTVSFFELLPDVDGLLGAPYEVNPEANIATISFTDGIEFPTSPTVGFTASTTELAEGDDVTFTFNVDGDIPPEGLTVVIGSTSEAAALEFDPAILGETPAGFAGPPEVTARNVLLTLTDPNASITLTLAEDGIEEGTETVNLFLEDGELYEVDPGNSSIDLSVSDEPVVSDDPVVSFEVIPSAVSEEGTFEERTIVFQYTVEGEIPEGGLSVLVSNDNLEAFTSQGFEVGPGNFNGLEFGEFFSEELNAFELILTQNVATAEVVLANDLIQEEDVTVNFLELLPDPDGLLSTPYVVNPDSNIGTISFTDGVDFPTSPTVGFTASTIELAEGDDVTFTFAVDGDIPPEGLTVVIGSTSGTAALEFDPAVLGTTSDGFAGPPEVTAENVLLTLTDPNASITLTLAEDGFDEGTETVNLFLEDGELYEVDPANGSIDLSVSDEPVVVGDPVVGLEILPTAVSEADSLEERTVTFNFNVDGDIPEGGLSILVSNSSLESLIAQGLEDSPSEFNGVEFGSGFFPEIDAFELILTQNDASVVVALADDLIQEEDTTINIELIEDTDGLLSTPYALDPATSTASLDITDGIDFPTSPVIGFSADTTTVAEGDAVTFTFDVEGDIPEEGVTLVFGSESGFAALEFDPSVLSETPPGFAGPPVVTFDSVQLTLVDPDVASLTLTLAEDGIDEGTETVNLFLQDGELYEVDPANSSVDLSVSDDPIVSDDPVVSFEVIPTAVSEEGSLEERTITFQYSVDGDIPDGGLSVLVSLDDLGDFTSQGLEVGPSNFQNLEFGDGFFEDINAFELVILDEVGSFDVVLEDDLIQEEDTTVTFFELLPDSDGLLGNPYVVNTDANIANISLTDGIEFPTSPTVGFTASATELVEGDDVTFTFDVDGDIPAEGLTVVLGSTSGAAALEFDPAILGTTPEGFAGPPVVTASNVLLTLTDADASITLTLAEDGLDEGTETVNLFLEDGELYEVDPANGSIDLSVSDEAAVTPDIIGTGGSDRIIADSDDNVIDARGGSDEIRARAGDDTVFAGGGGDNVFGNRGNDLIFGEGGSDFLRGQSGDDRISGGNGGDSLFGDSGNDVLSGDAGNDIIRGGSGDDLLMGVTGNDTLFGGSGVDTFVFGNGDGTDTVNGFRVGVDLIGLVEGELSFSDIEISQDGRNAVLGVTSTGETLASLTGVNASALTEDSFVSVPDISDLNALPSESPFV